MPYTKVLLIDDDEDDQEIFLMAMQEVAAGIQCTAFDSAQTALKQLENRSIMADLIFLDLNMPIMSGQQFLAELKKREGLNNIPVIILSTSSNFNTINETMALGSRHFITKPSDFTELKEVLQKILD